jgi:hypothetical protein
VNTTLDPSDRPSPLLHLVHPGVALQARYSEYHTVRVQLQGTGRYYLFPPQHAAHPLHVYPSVHQHAAQAQVHIVWCLMRTVWCSTCAGNLSLLYMLWRFYLVR